MIDISIGGHMGKNCISRINENGDIVIEFYGTFKAYDIYGTLMNSVNEYVLEELRRQQGVEEAKAKIKPPIISLKEVTWMEAATLPLLLSSCRILRDYFGKPITFIHPKADRVREYLFCSRFNSCALGYRYDGTQEKSILDFDRNEVEKFDSKGMNPKNIIETIQAETGFYEKDSEDQYRMKLSSTNRTGRYIKRILSEYLKEPLGKTEEYDNCLNILTELISNASLYSDSDPFVCVQMKSKKEYYFTICDTGIGFYKSIERKNEKLPDEKKIDPLDSKKYLRHNINNTDLLSEFFAFFTAMEKVSDPLRQNLRKLIRLITSNGGDIKIHTDRVLMCFSKKDLFYFLNDEPYKWMNHLIENSSSDYRESPLCIYRSRLRGVHIEVIFGNGE